MMHRILLLFFALAAVAWPGVVPGRYIVELEEESGPAAGRLARVRARQTDARQRLSGLAQVRLLGSVERVGNHLLVEAADPGALAALPGVRRVHAVHTVKLHLDKAIAAQKIDEAWRMVGEDRAGTGIKVGVIDSGVDIAHPGLGTGGLAMPAGFPKFNRAEDEVNTSAKVIVARSYVSLLGRRDPDLSARDRVGHGTALSMIIAGGRTPAPLAPIAGIAPRAQIGSYKVFGTPNFNDDSSDDVIIKAIDDAVGDGMDVINLSLGSDVASRLEDDPLAQAVERATKAGVIVVTSAGNNGPEFGTINSPATAPSAIAVGATRNGRTFAASVRSGSLGALLAFGGSGPSPAAPVSAAAFDIFSLDATRLGCNPFPAGSLGGRIAVISRGDCTFEIKINNAQAAGAVAALVLAAPASPDAFRMGVGAARLPAMMIGAGDGQRVREELAASAELRLTLDFSLGSVDRDGNRLMDFSSIGPAPDLALKPEITAVGGTVLTATQKLDPTGDMYNASGFIVVDGTSFSAPMVAGAAALLKAARPGLTVEQYRSLLINAATPSREVDGATLAIAQKAGAGQLDLGASVRSTIAVAPAAISFGAGTADARAKTTLRIHNLGSTAETYSFQVVPREDSAGPAVPASATADALGFVTIELPFEASGLRGGAHEGRIRVAAATGAAVEVPYWYAVRGTEAAAIPLILAESSGRRGALVSEAVLFRVVDTAGVPLAGGTPELVVRQGEGTATLVNFDNDSPGLYGIEWRLGPLPGANVVRIQMGEKYRDVTIVGN